MYKENQIVNQLFKKTVMKTITEVRKAFWNAFPEFKSEYRKTWRQNQYNATIRSCFVDYVDSLRRDGQISESLVNRVTL